MIDKETIAKYAQFIMLLLISLVLIFWPYIQPILPRLSYQETLGFFVAVLAGMFLYFDSRLSDAIQGPTRTLTLMNLSSCFNYLSQTHQHVKYMRIFALSTGRIHPLFSSSNIQVDKCDILLRDFTSVELEIPKNVEYRRHINDYITEWEKERNKGKIREIKIRKFLFIPTEYYVIFDDKYMIVGLYQPTDDNWGDVIDPFLIQNSSPEGAELIKRYIARFEAIKVLLDEKQSQLQHQ
jgi:hypothetical protein